MTEGSDSSLEAFLFVYQYLLTFLGRFHNTTMILLTEIIVTIIVILNFVTV